jgi:tetratricopeptide (TPR) repeat protein
VAEFEQLLRIKVNHLGALLHLAGSFDALGQSEKAKELFQKVLKLDRDNPRVQDAWIEFCVKKNDKETAVSSLNLLLDKTVTSVNAEQIVKFSKMMIQFDPDHVFARMKLIEALQTLGDFDGAADAYCALALLYEQKNIFDDAVKCLEKALLLSPANAEVLEKAATEMRQKALMAQTVSVSKEFGGKPEFLEEKGQAEVVQTAPAEPVVMLSEPEPPSYSNPDSANTFEARMSTANMCVQQGLLKAAIDIYQQLLAANPGLAEVRDKLKEVNDNYLKKWVDSKMAHDDFPASSSVSVFVAENKVNTDS